MGGYVRLLKTPVAFPPLSCDARNHQKRIYNVTLYTNSGHVFNYPKDSYVLPLLFYHENPLSKYTDVSIVLQEFCKLWKVSRFCIGGIISFLCAFLSSKVLVLFWQGPQWKNIKENNFGRKVAIINIS